MNKLKTETQLPQTIVTGSAVFHGDCLEIMKSIPDGSIDMILCDLPYGTTICKWDVVIPFAELWQQYNRVIKLNGAIVLTASQPFTSILVNSNLKMFKYEWIYEKSSGSNFAVVKYQPMKEHENILVFSKNKHNYFPILQERKGSGLKRIKSEYKSNTTSGHITQNLVTNRKDKNYSDLRNPSSVQFFNNRESSRGLHPTQKPVALFEYLIKTYTQEGEKVLDNCAGSGTTGIACINTNRNYILIEKEQKYFDIINERIDKHNLQRAGEFSFENQS